MSEHPAEHTRAVPSPGATGELRDGIRGSLDTYKRSLSADLLAAEGATRRGDHDEAVATLLAHIERLEAMHRELNQVVAGAVAVREAETVVEHAEPEVPTIPADETSTTSQVAEPPSGGGRRGQVITTLVVLGLATLSLLPGLPPHSGDDAAKGILLAEADQESEEGSVVSAPAAERATPTPPPVVPAPPPAPLRPAEHEGPPAPATAVPPDTPAPTPTAGPVFAASTPTDPDPHGTETEQAGLLGLPGLELSDDESPLLPDNPEGDPTRR